MRETPSEVANRFILITGIGHCGTGWMRAVLHNPLDRMVCYHEHKVKILPLNWVEALQYEMGSGVGSMYDPYFRFMRDKLERYDVVGDSGSWTMAMVPEVDKRLHIDYVIHIVRNGIQNIHSFYEWNKEYTRDMWVFTDYLPWYKEVMGSSDDISGYTPWEYWCWAWAEQNLKMPRWMGDRLGDERVRAYRFEDLLSNVDALANLIEGINPNIVVDKNILKDIQETDVNRKIEGKRSPEFLFDSWTEEQRESFERICRETMEYYGYWQ